MDEPLDKFGQPVPADPGYKEIWNADGTKPRSWEKLVLGPGIVVTSDPANKSSVLATTGLPTATPSRSGGMSAADKSKVDNLPITVDSRTVVGVSSITTAPWTADAYDKIEIDFFGTVSAHSFIQLQAGGITTALYTDCGTYTNVDGAAPLVIANAKGTLSWSQVGVAQVTDGALSLHIELYPGKTGAPRTGHFTCTSVLHNGATNQHYSATGSFGIDDLTTDITSVVLSLTGATFSGRIRVIGHVPFQIPLTNQIFFLGDSITEGGVTGGFRNKILASFAGWYPTGTLTTDPPPLAPGRIKHEGHNGFTSAQILSALAGYWSTEHADLVTVHLGTNDAISLFDPQTTADNIAAIVDYIHTQSPSTFICVAGIINSDSSLVAHNLLVNQQRPLVQSVCAARTGWTKYVVMPHLTNGQLDGGYHPVNAAAYNLLADAWLGAF